MRHMESDKFLFDTYAILEIIEGNEHYKKYLNSRIIINDFIFAELCFTLFRKGHPKAKELINDYRQLIIHAPSKAIEIAMQFRIEEKKRSLSIPDCISYVMAKELGIKFLTGDKEFKNLDGVEFVPK